jgi:hypothetical protein
MRTLMSEIELEVLHDDRDVVIRDGSYDNKIRLRPGQVLQAATSLLDMAECLSGGIWRKVQPVLRTLAGNGRPAAASGRRLVGAKDFCQVAWDFSVGTAEGEGAENLVLEQWSTAVGELGEPATLSRLYMTPAQSARVVGAMLEALRLIATHDTCTAAVEGLQAALDERERDRQARLHRLVGWLRARRQAREAEQRCQQWQNEACQAKRELRKALAKVPNSKPRRRRRTK